MQNKALDQLVNDGDISSYLYQNIDENGIVGSSKCRNTEQLVLTFPSGKTLKIDTFCSGCLENTILALE